MTDDNDKRGFVTEPQHDAVSGDAAPNAVALCDTDPMIVLAYETLRHDFDALRVHAPRAGSLPDAEAIHQMRIASRRMRVALKLFAKLLPDGARQALNAELRWFARALGEVRDLDVYAENFGAYVRAAGLPADALPGYALALQHARSRAREHLGAVFASERFRALLDALQDLCAGPPAAALRRWRSFRIDAGAGPYLRAARRRILKRGSAADRSAPAERLHAVRIAAKRFRYEVELFAQLYPALRSHAKAAKRVQDLLGVFQDATTAIDRLQRCRRHAGEQAEEAAALDKLLHALRTRAADSLDGLDEEWRRFEKVVTERSLAKAVKHAAGERRRAAG